MHPPLPPDRRDFLKLGASAVASALVWPDAAARASGVSERPPIRYVDGLSFLSPDSQDVERSGLTAMILDVSSVGQLKTDDGSIKYFRSFEACATSMTAMRRALASGGHGKAFLATRGGDIDRAFAEGRTAVFFQMQGAEPIGESLDRLDMFYELGLRVQQITHHNNNAWGGGAIEKTWTGLTPTGIRGIERLNALGIIPDLSHASDVTALDVLRVSKQPVVYSHGGARALVPNARCAPDDVIRGVGGSGGVMGIFMMTMWLTTDAQPTVEAYVRQIRHVANVAGIDAVGIANDYTIAGELSAARAANDNAKVISNYFPWWDSVARQGVMGFEKHPQHAVIPALNNVRRMFLIHEALDKAGFRTGDVEKIMGGNWTRVLKTLA